MCILLGLDTSLTLLLPSLSPLSPRLLVPALYLTTAHDVNKITVYHRFSVNKRLYRATSTVRPGGHKNLLDSPGRHLARPGGLENKLDSPGRLRARPGGLENYMFQLYRTLIGRGLQELHRSLVCHFRVMEG